MIVKTIYSPILHKCYIHYNHCGTCCYQNIAFQLPLATGQSGWSSGKKSALKWQKVASSNPTQVICPWNLFTGLGKVMSIQCFIHTYQCMGKTRLG